jgi:hypothetical protein
VEYVEAPVADWTHVLVEVAGPVEIPSPLAPDQAAQDPTGRERLWSQREGATAREAADRGSPVHKLDVAVALDPAWLLNPGGLLT